mmetsp:Transcript_19820/g.46527  ORF Transcript_19820/g.46527 Transcript_19820/m.46527 type:complete len:350 (+) Transcript_19820:102-1151(+)
MDHSSSLVDDVIRRPLHRPQECSPKSAEKHARVESIAATHQGTSPMKDALSGGMAGAVSKTAVAPIERVKLLMQLEFSLTSKKRGEGRRLRALEIARNVYRDEGLLAFWRGNTPNVIRQGGTSAMNFFFMDWYKGAICSLLPRSQQLSSDEERKRNAFVSSFLSGGLAGGTTTSILYPIEFMRTRLAMDVGRGTKEAPRMYAGGMRDVCASIWRTDGLFGFYQGFGIALVGVVVYRALHLGGYDVIKTEIVHRKMGDDLSWTERFVAAQAVSVFAGTACYPIDSVRRRLMMQAGIPKGERIYANSVDCFLKVFAEEGHRGLFLGLGPNLVRSVGAALLLVSYDAIKEMI